MTFSKNSTIVQHTTRVGTKKNTAYWSSNKKKKNQQKITCLGKTYIPKCIEIAQEKILYLYAHYTMKATC